MRIMVVDDATKLDVRMQMHLYLGLILKIMADYAELC